MRKGGRSWQKWAHVLTTTVWSGGMEAKRSEMELKHFFLWKRDYRKTLEEK
jgi:hypothetical protein